MMQEKPQTAAELILKLLIVPRQGYAAFLQKKGFLPPRALVFPSFSPSGGFPCLAAVPPAAPLPRPHLPRALLAAVLLQPCML